MACASSNRFAAYRDNAGVLYWHWPTAVLRFPPLRPYVVGILNITPDSFSDGGAIRTVEAAVARALDMAQEGADVIDVGGQSTRPGYLPISLGEEAARVLPVLEGIKNGIKDIKRQVLISVDTEKPALAKKVFGLGLAHMINDESGGDPAMAVVAADFCLPLILMHRPGEAGRDSIEAVAEDLVAMRKRYIDAGLTSEWIALDPGIGFGKKDNMMILRHCSRLLALDAPLYIGASRKRFIGKATGNPEADKRLGGSLAAALWAAGAGASFIRVHDVRETVEALLMHRALVGQDDPRLGDRETG